MFPFKFYLCKIWGVTVWYQSVGCIFGDNQYVWVMDRLQRIPSYTLQYWYVIGYAGVLGVFSIIRLWYVSLVGLVGELWGFLGYANLKMDLDLVVGCFLGEHTHGLSVESLGCVLMLLYALLVWWIVFDWLPKVLNSELSCLSFSWSLSCRE